MPYVIILNDDNTLYSSQKKRIMQRSKLVDDLWILVPQFYEGQDMSEYTVQMEYLLPCSKRYCTEILELSNEMYEDHLKYLLPFDTKLTSEAGQIQLQLTFVKTNLDENGKGSQKVRKTSTTTIEIISISAWSDIIPDSALSAIDERLIKLDASMRAMNEYMNVLDNNQVDNLVYDDKNETLQLSSKGKGIGDKVSVRNMLDEGTPVVDLDSDSGDDTDIKDDEGCDCGCDCEDIGAAYSVVEF